MLRTALIAQSRRVKQALVMLQDALLCVVAVWISFSLRLDLLHRPDGLQWLAYGLSPLLALPMCGVTGMYRAILRYTGLSFLRLLGKALMVYTVVYFLLLEWLAWPLVPRSIGLLQPMILFLLISASRILAREWLTRVPRGRGSTQRSHLVIYGAGSAGVQLANAIATSPDFSLIGFVDDNPSLHGLSVNGVTVHSPASLADLCASEAVTDVVLAVPSASRKRRNEIIDSLRDLPLHVRSMPGLSDLAHGRIALADLRELDVEDLLGREPTPAAPALLAQALRGQVVMVTGAGGSIGGELCRQILAEAPACLVLVESSEFALYGIHQQLLDRGRALAATADLVPVLGDVRDERHMTRLCMEHRPSVVFHAAAYKHVPLVESNPVEGIANNTLGTLSMAMAARAAGIVRFVLVSSDKAVRPTNVMGASKRFAELVLQALATQPGETCFAMVRFGNVLGSSGSVVPLFRRQIERGGPVTVTDPEVTRYFMTIPEAAQLVLQAGVMAQGGEVFVLDMGQPVRILDLARRMIGLSGLSVKDDEHPDGDIAIEFIGLRPGEKLYEELLIGDDPQATRHPRIRMAREALVPWDQLSDDLAQMRDAVLLHDVPALQKLLEKRVHGYRPKA